MGHYENQMSQYLWIVWGGGNDSFSSGILWARIFPQEKFSMLISISLETLHSIVWSEPLLTYRRLFFFWEGWSVDCLLFSGSSISEGSPGEAPSRHLQITSTGKMWLTWVTVLSFHGYCSGRRCCLWAKSLETIMTSAPSLKNRLCPQQEAEKKVEAGKQGYSKKSRFPSSLKY